MIKHLMGETFTGIKDFFNRECFTIENFPPILSRF